jgi:hypothetical protein
MTEEINPLWDKYIDWVLLPEIDKGEITTESEWATANSISDRTIRRWKQNEKFKQRFEERSGSSSLSNGEGIAKRDVSKKEGTGDEQDYKVVKSRLIEGAKNGNLKAQELYLKTYGKPFVEEEQAARTTDLSGMELEKLVLKSLETLGIDPIVNYLKSNGYDVKKSEVKSD